jgi:hypothetical protein
MKPKGSGAVGWSSTPSYAARYPVIAEWDVNQVKNRKRGLGETESKGHIVRQLGIASTQWSRFGVAPVTTYRLYSHSQVSNGNGHWEPPAYIGMTREDLERFVAVGLQILTAPSE